MVSQTNVTRVRLALTCYMSLGRRSIEPSEAEFKFSIRGGKLIGHTVYCVVDFSARIRVAGLAVYERFGLLSQCASEDRNESGISVRRYICRVALFLRVLKLVGHSNSRGGALANRGLSEKSEALLGADSS